MQFTQTAYLRTLAVYKQTFMFEKIKNVCNRQKNWQKICRITNDIRLPLPNTFTSPSVICASTQLRFVSTLRRTNIRNIHFNLTLWIVRSFPNKFFSSVLWPLLTSHSSLLLQISLPMRPHGINQYSFLVYLPDLRIKVTVRTCSHRRLSNKCKWAI